MFISYIHVLDSVTAFIILQKIDFTYNLCWLLIFNLAIIFFRIQIF